MDFWLRLSKIISRGASYAQRAVNLVAMARADDWVVIRELAEQLSLSPQFLTKILCALTSAGVLQVRRGKTRGFRLARLGTEVSQLDIVELFDRHTGLQVCVVGGRPLAPVIRAARRIRSGPPTAGRSSMFCAAAPWRMSCGI